MLFFGFIQIDQICKPKNLSCYLLVQEKERDITPLTFFFIYINRETGTKSLYKLVYYMVFIHEFIFCNWSVTLTRQNKFLSCCVEHLFSSFFDAANNDTALFPDGRDDDDNDDDILVFLFNPTISLPL